MVRFQLGGSYGKNLEMGDDTYKLRRKVIEIIYDANKIVRLPRINVIITERGTKEKINVLGIGSLVGLNIWIPKHTLKLSPLKIREVVYHEIVHTICKQAGHDEKCLLMKASVSNKELTRASLDKRLKEYLTGMRKY